MWRRHDVAVHCLGPLDDFEKYLIWGKCIKGVLYVRLMIDQVPRKRFVLEYKAHFGEAEWELLCTSLETHLLLGFEDLKILEASCLGPELP